MHLSLLSGLLSALLILRSGWIGIKLIVHCFDHLSKLGVLGPSLHRGALVAVGVGLNRRVGHSCHGLNHGLVVGELRANRHLDKQRLWRDIQLNRHTVLIARLRLLMEDSARIHLNNLLYLQLAHIRHHLLLLGLLLLLVDSGAAERIVIDSALHLFF